MWWEKNQMETGKLTQELCGRGRGGADRAESLQHGEDWDLQSATCPHQEQQPPSTSQEQGIWDITQQTPNTCLQPALCPHCPLHTSISQAVTFPDSSASLKLRFSTWNRGHKTFLAGLPALGNFMLIADNLQGWVQGIILVLVAGWSVEHNWLYIYLC